MFEIPIGFLNTQWFETHGDRKNPLEDLDWVKWFVHKMTDRKLADGEPPMGFAALSAEFVAFRGELIRLISYIESGTFSEVEAIALLNRYLVKTDGHRYIEFDGTSSPTPTIRFEPAFVDGPYVLSELALLWFMLLFEKDRTRIKICEDPDCLCYFYDESKNKSKRHCHINCSNRMKVRRHRKKKHIFEDQS